MRTAQVYGEPGGVLSAFTGDSCFNSVLGDGILKRRVQSRMINADIARRRVVSVETMEPRLLKTRKNYPDETLLDVRSTICSKDFAVNLYFLLLRLGPLC